MQNTEKLEQQLIAFDRRIEKKIDEFATFQSKRMDRIEKNIDDTCALIQETNRKITDLQKDFRKELNEQSREVARHSVYIKLFFIFVSTIILKYFGPTILAWLTAG